MNSSPYPAAVFAYALITSVQLFDRVMGNTVAENFSPGRRADPSCPSVFFGKAALTHLVKPKPDRPGSAQNDY